MRAFAANLLNLAIMTLAVTTAQKIKFSIKDFLIFCAVNHKTFGLMVWHFQVPFQTFILQTPK